MRKLILFLYTFILFFISCKSVVELQPTIQKKDGIQEIKIKEGQIDASIRYNGDYWFHNFDNKLYPTISNLYLDDLKSLNKGTKVKMLWSSHTTVLPYFSSVAFVYDETDVKKLEEDLFKHLKNNLKGTNIESEEFGNYTAQWTKMNYLVFDPITKTQTFHTEYFYISFQTSLF